MTVDAFDPARRTNAALIVDCAALGYLPEPVLDLTFGMGRFWTKYVPTDLTTNDLDPAKGQHHHDFRSTPWPTNSFSTVVFDPPYRMGGTPSTERFDQRYGLDRVMSPEYVYGLIRDGMRESARLATTFVLVKLQDSVSGGRLRPQSAVATAYADEIGLRLVDSLHVVGGRAQPAGRTQVRARHGYSTLLVFEVKR